MSFITGGAIVVSIFLFLYILYLLLSAKGNKKTEQQALSKLVAEIENQNNLSFGEQESFDHYLLALDRKNNKLLVVQKSDKLIDHQLISLSDYPKQRVFKKYLAIPLDKEGKKTESILETIRLELEHKHGDEIFIPFYHHIHHNLYFLQEREAMAKTWETRILETKQAKKV